MKTNDNLYTAMLAKATPADVPGLMRFFKTGEGQYGEGDQFLGIRVPITRAVVKQYQGQCTWAELEEWIASPYHEIRLAVLLVLVYWYEHQPAARETIIRFYTTHTKYINNWDLVDLTCHELLGQWLLDKDRTILYDWAVSDDIWRQRIAIVSTMAFIRKGEYDDTLRLCDMLIGHKHHLIHKATGWFLREVGKRDEKVLTDWLDSHYHDMPRTMLRYALERLSPEQRRHYMA